MIYIYIYTLYQPKSLLPLYVSYISLIFPIKESVIWPMACLADAPSVWIFCITPGLAEKSPLGGGWEHVAINGGCSNEIFQIDRFLYLYFISFDWFYSCCINFSWNYWRVYRHVWSGMELWKQWTSILALFWGEMWAKTSGNVRFSAYLHLQLVWNWVEYRSKLWHPGEQVPK